MYNINQTAFFGDENRKFIHYWNEKPSVNVVPPQSEKLIHRGDVIWYKDHISIVYSDRWGESALKDSWGTSYDIIHANGSPTRVYKKNKVTPSVPAFARKVRIDSIGSAINSDTLTHPKGFGRIKLWD